MLLLMLAALAQAQTTGGDVPDMNAQLFRSTADGMGLLSTDLARRAVHNQFAGRLLAHYTHEPLIYQPDGGEKIALVSSVTQADLVAAYGYDRLRFGVVLPIYLLSQGDVVGNETGLGDIALDGRVTALDATDTLPLSLGLQGRLHLPTATTQAPLGAPGVGWALAAVADVDLSERFLVAANLGIDGMPRVELENATASNQFIIRGAGHYLVDVDRDIGVALELMGRASLVGGNEGAVSTAEWLLGGHGRFVESSPAVLRAGVGSGLTRGLGSPDFRLVLGVGWEPRAEAPPPPDTDGDGLVDPMDGCPTDPEDFDGFQDEDGCPDIDNDQDGILDVVDACPNDPEDFDGYQDEDGCPEPEMPIVVRVVDAKGEIIQLARATIAGGDYSKAFKGGLKDAILPGDYTIIAEAQGYAAKTLDVSFTEPGQEIELMLEEVVVTVKVSRERFDLKDAIYFDTAKSTIQKRSFGLLDEAVKILNDYPEIRKLRIEGHTDSRGNDAFNLKLSQARAESVMKYFVDKGIDAARLTAVGYGEERPLVEGNNEAAWSKNRRVDFFVEEWKDSE